MSSNTFDARGLPMSGAKGYNPNPPNPTGPITPAMDDADAAVDGVWKQPVAPNQGLPDTDIDEKEPS